MPFASSSERQRARAAAFAAYRDALAFQLREEGETLASIEHDKRHIRHAAERHQLRCLFLRRDPALHEREVDVLLRIEQAFEILHGAIRRQHLQRDAVTREQFRVFLRDDVERAVGLTRAHRDGFGRRRIDEPVDERDDDRNDQQDRTDRPCNVMQDAFRMIARQMRAFHAMPRHERAFVTACVTGKTSSMSCLCRKRRCFAV